MSRLKLLGEVVGGKVVKSSRDWHDGYQLYKEKNQDDLFSKFPDKIKNQRFKEYSKDVTLLASFY